MDPSVSFLPLPTYLENQFLEGNILRKSAYRGRFAPTPSGPLHLGNLRTALVSWLEARLQKGTWFLRIDDLDTPRIRSGAIESIQKDLRWMGLNWDGPVIFQSMRKDLYYSVLDALKTEGKLYPCRCSRKVLSELRSKGNQQEIYPGTCRDKQLSWDSYQERIPSWRLKVDQEFADSSGDVVLRRADGFIAYHLATVVDELTMGINEVIRGEDLLSSIPFQLAVIKAINSEHIKFRFVGLMFDQEGRKLAKRDRSYGLELLKDEGRNPSDVIGYLAQTLDLVPKDSELSAQELLDELSNYKNPLKNVFGLPRDQSKLL